MLADGPMVTLALAAAGVIGTWFVMGYRIRELEKRCAVMEGRHQPLHDQVVAIDTRTRDSAVSQGLRLEKATIELAVLTGKVEGIDRGIDIGYAAGKRAARKDTAASGNKVPA
jgi:hypothetical protein